MAVQAERRAAKRYPLTLNLHYREVRASGPKVQGTGETINFSGAGILFAPSSEVMPGTRLEIFVKWPARLNGDVPLQLVMRGEVASSADGRTVMLIRNHEFRTQSRASNLNALQLPRLGVERASPVY